MNQVETNTYASRKLPGTTLARLRCVTRGIGRPDSMCANNVKFAS